MFFKALPEIAEIMNHCANDTQQLIDTVGTTVVPVMRGSHAMSRRRFGSQADSAPAAQPRYYN